MIVDRRIGLTFLLRENLRALGLLLAWDVVVVLVFKLAHRPWMDQPALPFALIGSALALFLGVRNTTASGRWWEARIAWGSVVNNTRSAARQIAALTDEPAPLVRALAAYAHALRAALARERADGDRASTLLPPSVAALADGQPNRPVAIVVGVSRLLAAGRPPDAPLHAEIERTLTDLIAAQGSLERIRNTPLAIQYVVLPGLFVRLFCLVLPLSMVQELGWITPVGSTLVGLMFLALDGIGEELADPFAPTVHALPMRAMATTIEIDLLALIGEAVPPPVVAAHGILR